MSSEGGEPAARSVASGLIGSMMAIGGARIVQALCGVVRLKVLALALGASGVGIFSLLLGLQQVATQLAGLGMATSGVRQLGAARDDPALRRSLSAALLWGCLAQGMLGMGLLWLLRAPLTALLAGPVPVPASAVGMLGCGVLAGTLSQGGMALLQGHRLIPALATATMAGAVGGSALAVAGVLWFGTDGLALFAIAPPVATALAALVLARRLPRGAALPAAALVGRWRGLAREGGVFLATGFLSMGTLLLLRARIVAEAGAAEAGLFHAVWTVSMVHVALLFTAMSADYFPRLSEVAGDADATARLVDTQTRIGMLVGVPVLLVMLGAAPLVLTALYTAEFAAASDILRWQCVGTVLKLAAWPLGFVLIARARSRAFFGVELFWNACFAGIVVAGLPAFGIGAAGPAFAVAYGLYLALLLVLVGGPSWRPGTGRLVGGSVAGAGALLALCMAYPAAGGALAVACGVLAAPVGLRGVLGMVGTTGRRTRRIAALYAAAGFPVTPIR